MSKLLGKLRSVLTFRKALRLACVFLILAAFLLPWWRIYLVYGHLQEGGFNVYPHGIYGGFPKVVPFQWTETRTEFLQLFTGIYLGCVALGVLGTILKGKKGAILLVVNGIILLTIVYLFHSRIVLAAATYGPYYLPAEGFTTAIGEGRQNVLITTGFQLGYYLAGLAGLLCVLSIPLEYLYHKFRHRHYPKAEYGLRKVTVS